MEHQSDHLIGVVAYGLMALVGFGAGVFALRRRPSNAASLRRQAGWPLFCAVAVALLWAGDEWRAATEWPPVRGIHHGILFNIGGVLILVRSYAVEPILNVN